MKYLLTALLFPGFFFLTEALVSLFYRCKNNVLLGTTIVVAALLAWYAAKTFLAMAGGVKRIVLLAFLIVASGVVGLFLFSFDGGCGWGARCAGPQALARMSLSSARAEAELVWSENDHSYESVCHNENIRRLLDAADESIHKSIYDDEFVCYGSLLRLMMPLDYDDSQTFVACNAQESSYALEVYSPQTAEYFCIDSSGNSGENDYSVGVATSCK